MLLPWNQRSLQTHNRAVEQAGFLRELFSTVVSASFDAECSDSCGEGGKKKERKTENCWWLPANVLLAHRWCARYGQVQCLIWEEDLVCVSRRQSHGWRWCSNCGLVHGSNESSLETCGEKRVSWGWTFAAGSGTCSSSASQRAPIGEETTLLENAVTNSGKCT